MLEFLKQVAKRLKDLIFCSNGVSDSGNNLSESKYDFENKINNAKSVGQNEEPKFGGKAERKIRRPSYMVCSLNELEVILAIKFC